MPVKEKSDSLLKLFHLPGGAVLKNRLLMAPMTTCSGFYDGTLTQEIVEYYRAVPVLLPR